jgi:cytochrome c oxidase subunit 1
VANVIFSALTMLVAIPSAVKVWNWLATLYKGSISLQTPMLYALGFFFMFGIGGLTGLPLATLVTDFNNHDTYFVVAHFHYVMFGGTLWMFVAGIHYWWPKMTGRMYNDALGRFCCLLELLAFNLTFLPQFILGLHGMSRRYAEYKFTPELQYLHVMSSIGAFIQFTSFFLIAAYLLHSMFYGKKAPANPWGGSTLEWSCASPPPHDNFSEAPSVGAPYDHRGLVYDESIGGFVRKTEELVPA